MVSEVTVTPYGYDDEEAFFVKDNIELTTSDVLVELGDLWRHRADLQTALAAANAKLVEWACPCALGEPCSQVCTCAHGHMSGGCSNPRCPRLYDRHALQQANARAEAAHSSYSSEHKAWLEAIHTPSWLDELEPAWREAYSTARNYVAALQQALQTQRERAGAAEGERAEAVRQANDNNEANFYEVQQLRTRLADAVGLLRDIHNAAWLNDKGMEPTGDHEADARYVYPRIIRWIRNQAGNAVARIEPSATEAGAPRAGEHVENATKHDFGIDPTRHTVRWLRCRECGRTDNMCEECLENGDP